MVTVRPGEVEILNSNHSKPVRELIALLLMGKPNDELLDEDISEVLGVDATSPSGRSLWYNARDVAITRGILWTRAWGQGKYVCASDVAKIQFAQDQMAKSVKRSERVQKVLTNIKRDGKSADYLGLLDDMGWQLRLEQSVLSLEGRRKISEIQRKFASSPPPAQLLEEFAGS